MTSLRRSPLCFLSLSLSVCLSVCLFVFLLRSCGAWRFVLGLGRRSRPVANAAFRGLGGAHARREGLAADGAGEAGRAGEGAEAGNAVVDFRWGRMFRGGWW